MRVVRTGAVVALFAMVGAVGAERVAAQQPALSDQPVHVAGADVLNQAVLTHAAGVEQERDRLRTLLARDDVRAIAAANAMDAGRLHDMAGTLDEGQLARLAPHLAAAEAALAGGQVISFNATTLILILLIIVVVVLIVD